MSFWTGVVFDSILEGHKIQAPRLPPMSDQMERVAMNLQQAIRNVRRISKTESAGPRWRNLDQEYLESSDDEVHTPLEIADDCMSIGSTWSDENGSQDNQKSASNSPIKAKEAAKVACQANDSNRMPNASKEKETNQLDDMHAMVAHVKSSMSELTQWKERMAHTVHAAMARIDGFVSSVTGHHPKTKLMQVERLDELVDVWEHEWMAWSHQWRDQVAHRTWEMQRLHQHAVNQLWITQTDREQMLLEDAASNEQRWQERLMAAQSPKEEIKEQVELQVADWRRRCLQLEEELSKTKAAARAHEDAKEMLQLQLSSLDARLEEALQQLKLQQEIAQHVQSTQVHEMREIEALNYKLLQTLVQQDEQLRSKEQLMLQRQQKLEADRRQLAQDQTSFELHKNEILKELKAVCDYVTIHSNSVDESAQKEHQRRLLNMSRLVTTKHL